MSSKKILIISHDKVGPTMAGPGIRYHQIATELSKTFEATLATFNPSYLDGIENVSYEFMDIKVYDFKSAFDKFDVIIALWLSEDMISYAKSRNKLLIFDLYAPVPIENLVSYLFSSKPFEPEDDYNYTVMIENYKRFLSVGDYFMTSNQTQIDFWTGYIFSTGIIFPSSYKKFPIYERFGLCPMGIDPGEFTHKIKTDPIRETFKQIKKSDFVIAWTGGIWDWFDAETPINAIKRLHDEGFDNIKLVFLATRHPNSDVPLMNETTRAIELAKKTGLLNKSVFFLDGWIPYEQRLDYLLASDIALYAHKPSIEARFSHRTRVLDHILACLPTLATAGDYFADYIEANNLGLVVKPQDIDAMAEGIKVLTNEKTKSSIRKNIEAIRNDFTWAKTLEPLKQFLSQDHEARQTPDIIEVVAVTNSSNRYLKQVKRYIPRTVKEQIKRRIVNKDRKA